MSRKRMFLTFAAEIEHFKEEIPGYRACTKGSVRAGEQGIGRIITV